MIASIMDTLKSGGGAVALLPLLAAIGLWALTDVRRFLLIAVMGAMILPATIVSPAGAQVALADLLLVLALAAWLVRNALGTAPDPWVFRNPLLPVLALFVAINFLSIGWSVDPRQTFVFVVQLVELVIVIPLAFATLPDSLKTIRTGMYAFVLFTTIMAVAAAIDFVPRAASGDLSGAYLPGLHKNAIGSFVGAGLAVSYTLWLGAGNPRERRLRHVLAAAWLLEFAGLCSSGSRGAIIGALLAVVTSSFLLGTRRRTTVIIAIIGAVGYLAVVGPYSGGGVKTAGGYDSGVVRQYSFDNAWEKIGERPLLGTGGGTYFDYIPQLAIGLEDPNNIFLLTWAELGFLGMGALLFLLTRYLQLFWRVSRLGRDGAVLGVAAGGIALSMFVHFQTDITWTRGTSSLTFAAIGLMLAVTRLAQTSQAQAVEHPRPIVPPQPIPSRERALAGSAR